jgi:hypothetical protein
VVPAPAYGAAVGMAQEAEGRRKERDDARGININREKLQGL